MASPDLIHLTNGAASVVIDATGPGLPVVAHWGPALAGADQDELAATVAALVPPLPSDAPDTPIRSALLPERGAGHTGRPGLRGHRAGTDWAASFALDRVERVDATTVRLHATDATAGLTLTTETHLAPGGLLRLRHTVRNDGDAPYTVDGLEAALPIPARATELLDFTGRGRRERHPQRHPLPTGAWVREGRRGRTGHDATIGLLAGTPGFGYRHGEVWAVHVAWSGNHVTYAERLPEGTSFLGGGESLLPGEVCLAPGESYTGPWLYAAYSPDGMDGVSAAFHAWLRSRPHHPTRHRPRPVALNVWEAVYFDHDLDRLRDLADRAATLGVERFVLDDGWFRHRRDDTAGLGDWYVDETVWPDGLHPLVDHVIAAGMEFGLWVEPEMVNPDSDLFRAHPDWVMRPRAGELPVPWRGQQVLDLVHPDAYAYILQRLDALLGEYRIGYLKWDHNRDLIDAGHDGRGGVHAQTTAVYRLLDELRARHPNVEIESCSSGGARVDLGILERTHRVWASDCIDALERQTIQRWTGLFLPPELIGTHVGARRSHTTGRTHDIGFRVAAALFGHFGIEWDIARADPAELERLAAAIVFVKENRALLHGGNTVRADLPDPATDLYGVVAPDRGAALYCYTQLATSEANVPVPLRLPGLDPRRRYRVTAPEPAGGPATHQRMAPPWLAAGGIVLTGHALATTGVRPPILHPEQAWLVRAEAVDDADAASTGVAG